jgi:hypothetical protein
MMYVKAAAIGILSGLLFAVVWVAAALWLPIYGQMFLSQMRNEGGVAAAYVGSGSAMLAALIGFTAGFSWTVRRARRRH